MEIDNTASTLDSRDIIERIGELEDEIEELEDTLIDPESEEDEQQCDLNAQELSELKEELEILKDVEDQANYGDWVYGEVLIHDDYWVDYCEELCKDIGDLPSELPWYINDHIDWEGVADELKVDYAEIDFDGETYYIRT